MITFPAYANTRCLMMPFVQGDPDSVPAEYCAYTDIIAATYLEAGKIGYLTIDESPVSAGEAHRAAHAKYARALHTEAGRWSPTTYNWGPPPWGWGPNPNGVQPNVTLERDTQILLANSIDDSAVWWNAEHVDTSVDGDIGDQAELYPYSDAIFMKAGEVHQIGILTPHESLRVKKDSRRQFLRIVGNGVHGREPYFTINPLIQEMNHV